MSLRQVHIVVHGADGQPLPNATVAWYERTEVLTTKADGSVDVFADSSITDVSIKVLHPAYQPYLQDPTKLLPPTNVNVGIGVPVGPTDVQFQPLVPLAPPVDLRAWNGNICGVRVPGLPPVPGGAVDASLVLSWFYSRYDAASRAAIRDAWRSRGETHVLLSWPDDRAVGQSEAQFVATCQELMGAGFAPCVMWYSKDYDPPDVAAILQGLVTILPATVNAGVKLHCIGWELSIALSPTQVQQLIDVEAPEILSRGGLAPYVHFQAGYASFQQPGKDFASFWNANVGKLTGLLHQKPAEWANDEYGYRLVDILDRFSGGFNVAVDSGFGHPFDLVAFEVTASQQFAGTMSEQQGNAVAAVALAVPPVTGPTGVSVAVVGTGNGR